MCLCSSDRSTNGVDKPGHRPGWVWWRWLLPQVNESSVGPLPCALAVGLMQSIAIHLEEGLFRYTNEALGCTWTWEASAWFHGFLLIFSSPKQVRQQTSSPTYWAYILLGEEKDEGNEHWDLVTVFHLSSQGDPVSKWVFASSTNPREPQAQWAVGGWWFEHKYTYEWVHGVRVYFTCQEVFKCGRYLSSKQALALAPLTVASLVAFVMKLLTSSADRTCQSAFPVTTHVFSWFSDSPLIPILRQWKPTFGGLWHPCQ